MLPNSLSCWASGMSKPLVAAMGLFILWRRWREASRLQIAQMLSAIPVPAPAGSLVETTEQPQPDAGSEEALYDNQIA